MQITEDNQSSLKHLIIIYQAEVTFGLLFYNTTQTKLHHISRGRTDEMDLEM